MIELHDDDKPIGRVLTRREMLKLLGGASAAILTGVSFPRLALGQSPTPLPLPACVVRPELTEGPYFVDEQLERFDIRTDPSDESIKAGIPLLLTYRLLDVTGGMCAPLAGAMVDIWHCDAAGVYSGVQDRSFDTREEKWLRGYQISDEEGIAKFLTIVPGWYSGRAVHIHFKIRTETGYEFTSQLFFDPEEIEEIYALPPYAAKGLPDRPNEQDNIYQQSEGQLTLTLLPMENDMLEELELEAAYSTVFDIGLDLSDAAVGASDRAGGRRP